MQLNEVVLVDIVRTAFGRAGEKGIFWNTRAEDLAIPLLKALINRNPKVLPSMIQDSIWGRNQPGQGTGQHPRPDDHHAGRLGMGNSRVLH